jgi:cytochrome bd-type quinol oxidase subunit 2
LFYNNIIKIIINLKMKKIFFMVLVVLFSSVAFVYAAAPPSTGLGTVDPASVGRDSTYSGSDIGTIFADLVNWFAWFVAVVSVVMGLYSGFLFITSAGDEAKLKKARDVFVYTIIGIVVAIISFSIVLIAKTLILS